MPRKYANACYGSIRGNDRSESHLALNSSDQCQPGIRQANKVRYLHWLVKRRSAQDRQHADENGERDLWQHLVGFLLSSGLPVRADIHPKSINHLPAFVQK